jgi:hypothetical protein
MLDQRQSYHQRLVGEVDSRGRKPALQCQMGPEGAQGNLEPARCQPPDADSKIMMMAAGLGSYHQPESGSDQPSRELL